MYQNSSAGMQEVIQMCSTFESNKSTKGASKLRRDLINGEIANLRDLLPLPSSTRQRLSQLQLMALVCVYVRKANYFQQVFKRFHELGHPYCTPNIGFSKALSGFLIMMTQNGKLLYISDNAAEYLGHSMEDLLIHGDSVYDIIDKADHGTVQAELLRNSNAPTSPGDETRLFLCRMNVSRNARRQMRFGDQKVVLLQGHYLSYLPLCSRNEPVFVATCTPVAMPETRECVVQGATNVFTTVHAMDMKFMHIDRNGEYYLGYTRSELGGISWYELIHWNYMREAQSKHRLISQSEQEKSCILLVRMQKRSGGWIWVHCVLQVKDSPESSSGTNTTAQPSQQQSVIVATNQVLSEREAAVMRANAWIYHYYTVQTKLQYGLAYPEGSPSSIMEAAVGSPTTATAAAARLAAAAAYFPTPQQLLNYGTTSPQTGHLQSSPDSPSANGGYGSPPLMTPAPPYTGTLGHPYSYHHRSYEMASSMTNVQPKKETPIDFSVAGSPAPPFDFHLAPTAGYPHPGTYWTHYHPSYHSTTNSLGSSYTNRGSDVSSPQTWSLSSSVSTSQNTSKHQHQHSNLPSSYPSSTQLSLSPTKGRKRSKKPNSETVLERSQSPTPLTSDGVLARRLYSPSSGHYSSGADPTVAAVTTMFPYHAPRSRGLYKLGVSGDDSGLVSSRDDSMILTCPLTPSPIWEGQTQRVGEVPLYSEGSGSGGGLVPGVGHDVVHCFPTYHSYLPFCATPTTTGGFSATTYNVGMGYYGNSTNATFTTAPVMIETGSPNKENRLPPTPESSDQDGETEERPVKWETL